MVRRCTLVLVSLLAGCGVAGAYPCQQDSQCLDGAVMGVCQPEGWCSFPADGCPSGQRFGDHAGDGVAGMCVDEPATTSGEDVPATATGLTGGGETDGGSDPTMASLEDTSPLDDGEASTGGEPTATSIDPSTATTSDADASDSAATGGMLPTCGNAILEPPEQCDGQELGGADCVTLGDDDGILFCDEDCTFDTSMCIEYEDEEYLPCLLEDDCDVGEICYLDAGNGTCLEDCNEPDDCPAVMGAQAPICDGGFCKLPCQDDSQCPELMRCDVTPTGLFCFH